MLWQSREWRRYQLALGREVLLFAYERDDSFLAGASVVVDRTAGGFCTWECPRGPLWTDDTAAQELVQFIAEEAARDRCLVVWMSPPFDWRLPQEEFHPSRRHIHPRATVMVDISQSEQDILAQMHQKGRYNIKVAEKQGVTTAVSRDIDAFYALLTGTGRRDGFTIHQKSHYTRFLESLDGSVLLLASHAGTPIAGLLGCTWNGTGTYYYGASSYEHRALMAPYALQWAAMRHCKELGCTRYDLLGIDPPGGKPTAWKGITDFKKKFGGETVVYPAEQQLTLRPLTMLVIAAKRAILG
jgi:lipid II:glycine glycyltransferase (peptidoglycan interpeptide bridge formation enzyme)